MGAVKLARAFFGGFVVFFRRAFPCWGCDNRFARRLTASPANTRM